MHLTIVKTKDGKTYEGIILNVKDGLTKEPPYITLRTLYGDKDIHIFDMVSAITENERTGLGKIQDFDELPRWLELYKEFSNKENK